MKAYDLKPTYENLLATYQDNTIERNADVFRFIEILNSIEDSCSIAVDGNWGSGKTFFVKQVKMVLDAHNPFIKIEKEDDREEIVSTRKRYYGNNEPALDAQVCVYYDAWENDNDEDPVMSLVYTILQSVHTDYTFEDRDWLAVGTSIIDAFTGHNWTQVVENLRGSSPFEALKANRDIRGLVSEFLASLLPEKGNRLVVFIDELDRCKPSYAVRLLERIKHYFDHDYITFVFSVNSNELHHTIKKYYGVGFDGSRYLDRFFDLRVTLPQPNLDKFYRSLNFDRGYYVFDGACDAVIKTYRFELREIAKYLRLTKVAAHSATHDNKDFRFSDGMAAQFCMLFIVPIMIGLKINNAERYRDFIQGNDDTPLIEIAQNFTFRVFDELLSNNETYSEDDLQKTFVKLEDKLKSVYDALFVTVYNETVYHTKIGKYSFDKRTKDLLLRVTGLLSKYTNPNLD